MNGQVSSGGVDSETLVGVNVVIKGTTNGTVTDVDGNFSLSVPRGGTLVFSSIGYLPREVVVENQTRLDVVLDVDVKSLEEVVIVGYGQQKKKDITGSISSISHEEIENQPVASIDNLLQGRAAGVQISQSSGAPAGSFIYQAKEHPPRLYSASQVGLVATERERLPVRSKSSYVHGLHFL